jgi:hypothetical protein
MSRIAAAVLTLGLLLAVTPAAVVHAATTHKWVGADPADPHAWSSAKNWDTQKVPVPGDSVEIRTGRVEDVPPLLPLDTVTLSDGAELGSGGPLLADRLELMCGRLAIDATIGAGGVSIGGELREGVSFRTAGTFVVRTPNLLDQGCGEGVTVDPGVLKLFPGASWRNAGTIRGGDGTIQGMTCCTNPQVLENVGRIDATDKLTLANLRLLHRGRLVGGELTLSGGDHSLRDGSTLGGSVIARGARITVPPASSGGESVIALGGGKLLLTGSSELRGKARWSGTGTLFLEGGVIGGDQVIGPQAIFSTSGTGAKSIGPSAGSPGRVTVEGSASIGTGTLTLGGSLVIEGHLRVGMNRKAIIKGTGCCTDPVPTLWNRGQMEVASGASLEVLSMRLALNAPVRGTGQLLLGYGRHVLGTGAVLDVPTLIKDGALVKVQADTEVGKTVYQSSGATVGVGSPGPTIGGAGRWTWVGGDMAGNLAFGPDLSVVVKGAELKRYTSDRRLTVRGPLRIEGPGPLQVRWGGTFATTGAVTLVGANVTGSSCCIDTAVFTAAGPVSVVPAAGASLLSMLDTRFTGLVDLNGGTLDIDSLDPAFRGDLRLEGGTLDSNGVVTLGSASILAGPGTLNGLVQTSGVTTFSKRGRLLIGGSFSQDADGRLVVRFETNGRDWVDVDGPATIAGELLLGGNPASVTRPTIVLRAVTLSGTFGKVTSLPSSHIVGYGSDRVTIAPK